MNSLFLYEVDEIEDCDLELMTEEEIESYVATFNIIEPVCGANVTGGTMNSTSFCACQLGNAAHTCNC